ncbi:MAG TPA: response regulator transcription factor [Dehalococcoidia bacterium]|nr:response regulator transcription factor [Dehalococcoidia bacterium]
MAGQPCILVVDDDARIVASLRRALIYEGYRVETAGDGPAALACTRERLPDLVVLDVMLPGIDGMEVCRRLRDDGDIPILMLTARDATADRVRGLDSGADDYLAKPFAYEEFLARVRALLRRRAPQTNAVLRYADLSLDADAHQVHRGERAVAFTAQEFELLRLFLRHPRQVLTRDQILEAAWGYESEAVSNVVDVYVGYLRQKLEAGGEPRLLHTVRGVGYVLREGAG